MERHELAALSTLLRWLGPWASPHAMPHGIRRELWLLREGPRPGRPGRRDGASFVGAGRHRLQASVFHPTGRRRGTYLIAPGLHFDGPADPRLERFCRILARAGFLVVAPMLPSFAEQIVEPAVLDDFEMVGRGLVDRYGAPFSVFSVSFGSWPALELAARMPDEVASVITFGGYADFESAVRFAIDGIMRRPEGDVATKSDPLNPPAVFLNVLPWIDVQGDTRALEETWREMMFRTWGRMELKQPGRLVPFAEELAPRVPPEQRELFLMGCGVRPGGAELIEAALGRAGDAIRIPSPARALEKLRCPIFICHGVGDDVIPWNEAEKLHRAVRGRVPARLLLTGLYGHTAASRLSPVALLREARTLMAMMRALATGGAAADG